MLSLDATKKKKKEQLKSSFFSFYVLSCFLSIQKQHTLERGLSTVLNFNSMK